MADITIPPAALEAALEAFAHASGLGILPDDEYDEEWREDLQNGMRAACLAMLEAWPGMGPIRTDQPIGDWCDKLPAIILPLPTEGEETDWGKPQGKEAW